MLQEVAVTKRFTFEACHRLVNYKGPCENYHGHSYKMEVTVKGVPNNQGLVLDFKVLKHIVNETIIDKVDHRDLNEVMPLFAGFEGNTTCENMIISFWKAIGRALDVNFLNNIKLYRIRLWETEDSYAELTADML